MKYRKSILHDYNAVAQAIERSSSIKECLQKLGLRAAGGNYKQFHEACKRHNLIPPNGTGSFQVQAAVMKNTRPLEEVLVENSDYHRGHLKRRLIKQGLLINHCYECKLSSVWNDKPISMTLDHINGRYNDNRIENLRLLCPNCHSQTETFCVKNR